MANQMLQSTFFCTLLMTINNLCTLPLHQSPHMDSPFTSLLHNLSLYFFKSYLLKYSLSLPLSICIILLLSNTNSLVHSVVLCLWCSHLTQTQNGEPPSIITFYMLFPFVSFNFLCYFINCLDSPSYLYIIVLGTPFSLP